MGGDIFLPLDDPIVLIVIGLVFGALFTGGSKAVIWVVWTCRKWRFRGNWDPILDHVNLTLKNLFSEEALAPPPAVAVRRGEVPVAQPQSFVRRKDGLIVRSHVKKDVIIYANDDEIRAGFPFDASIVNLVRQLLIMRGDPFLAHLPADLYAAIEDLCLNQTSGELGIDSDLIAHPPGQEYEADVTDSSIAVEDMYNSGQLATFTKDVANVYAEVDLSERARQQAASEFWSRYEKLEKEFAGLLLRSSQTQVDYLRHGLRGILIPPRFSKPSTHENWPIFFWADKNGILAKAEVVAFYSGSFQELWRKHRKQALAIAELTERETRPVHESWAKGLGGVLGKAKFDGKARGRALNLLLIEIQSFRDLIRFISVSKMKKLGIPTSSLVRLTLGQVTTLLERSMPKPQQADPFDTFFQPICLSYRSVDWHYTI